jgi:23S rRNA pseudouridine2604 synthase
VRVEGRLPAPALAQLNFGLSLDGVPLKRAEVSWQNRDQLRFILREGKSGRSGACASWSVLRCAA